MGLGSSIPTKELTEDDLILYKFGRISKRCCICGEQRFTEVQVNILENEKSTFHEVEDVFKDSPYEKLSIPPLCCHQKECIGQAFARIGGWNNIDFRMSKSIRRGDNLITIGEMLGGKEILADIQR